MNKNETPTQSPVRYAVLVNGITSFESDSYTLCFGRVQRDRRRGAKLAHLDRLGNVTDTYTFFANGSPRKHVVVA